MDITAPNKLPKVRRRRGFLLRLLGFMFAASMIVFVAVAAAAGFMLWKVSKDLPDYEVLAKYEPPVMTRIHANDGNLIAEFARERRIYVPFKAIPDRLVDAFLSAEDKTFYQHGGIDIQGILRAAVTNLGSSGSRKVGASTITQQVAKNFLLSSDQTMERKLKEAILSIRIERAFTKEQILELYLNEIYLGGGAYGVAAAAQTYWNKSLNELSIADCAYLATLPKAPSNYNPFRFPERAIERRNWVIDRMVENGFVTKEDAEKAKAEPLGVQVRQTGARLAFSEYFAEEVRRDIIDLFGEDKLYGGGLSVRTTLDPGLQKIARKTFIDGLVAYDHRHGWRGVVKNVEPRRRLGQDARRHQCVAGYRTVAACRGARGQQGHRQDRPTPDAYLCRQALGRAGDWHHPLRRSDLGPAEAEERHGRKPQGHDRRAQARRRHLRLPARADRQGA